MCGIFAYSGSKNNASQIVLEGLKRLDYRGYDSWGIAALAANKELKTKNQEQETFNMGLQAGIVGLPNVGKSTLFNAVSNSAKAQASNYRFCTIEPNVGLVDVPDLRLSKLAALVHPNRIVPTQIEIVDIAGLVRSDSFARACRRHTGESSGRSRASMARPDRCGKLWQELEGCRELFSRGNHRERLERRSDRHSQAFGVISVAKTQQRAKH